MDKNTKYWILGGAATVIGTNIMNYLLTSYLVGTGYKNSIDSLKNENEGKDRTIAEQKINLDSLTKNFTEKQKALADTIASLKERKEDYQTGIEILSKYLDKEINIREKMFDAYSKKRIRDGEAFRWMMKNLPVYKPKSQTKQKIPSKK